MTRVDQTGSDRLETASLLLAATGLIAGLGFWFAGRAGIASLIRIAGVAPARAALVAGCRGRRISVC
jgi:hypothetical protein